jgi:hypothetical protein
MRPVLAAPALLALGSAATAAQPADLIVTNARVHTARCWQ